MRRVVVALIVLVMVVSAQGLVFAVEGPVKKLSRGFANVATSPWEMVDGWKDKTKESGFIAGVIWGTASGVVNTCKRAAVGAYEVATFPLPYPVGYKPIIDDPEFFFDKDLPPFSEEGIVREKI
ncbi:MAG: exosortase system-associated protein, TIGR04073 family [Candidatus Omnitrophica bacterium]|nr:exosortase system-associated protein, TIGR04073 family [Candidatus Omnitrophota bacterium]